MVLGNGSNVLVRDGGYRGVIVKLGHGFDQVSVDGETLRCGSGALLSAAARDGGGRRPCRHGMLVGDPGSIGGAVFMNAGAYGGEIKDVLRKVTVISADGARVFDMDAQKLELGYRQSLCRKTGDIVLEASSLCSREMRRQSKKLWRI